MVIVVLSQSRVRLLWLHGLSPARVLCPWDFPGKNTRVGFYFLLQGIFSTRIKPASPALQGDSLPTTVYALYQGNPLAHNRCLINLYWRNKSMNGWENLLVTILTPFVFDEPWKRNMLPRGKGMMRMRCPAVSAESDGPHPELSR